MLNQRISNANIFIQLEVSMDCAICLTFPNNPQTVPCCQQTFCSECLSSWVTVRNCCPLCIAPFGIEQHNQLAKQESNEFDNGGLMLEGELALIVEKFNFLRMIYESKKATSNNYKSNFPKASLNFVQNQMRSVEENMEIAQLSVSQGDRVTATATIQNIAETLLDIQAILMGESTVEFQEEGDYSDEEEEDYDYEMQEELYSKRDKEKHKAAMKASGKKRVHELMN